MALNLQDYEKTSWEPKMPITQDRMNKLENGVEVNREALQSLDDSVTQNTNALSNAATKQELRDLSTSVSSAIAQNAASGQHAMTELRKVIVINPSTQETTYGLDNMKSDLESAILTLNQTLGTKMESSGSGSEAQTVPAYNTTNTVYNAIENLISAIGRDAQGNLIYSYNSDPVYNNTIFKNLSAIQTDLNNARGTSESLTQRLYVMSSDIIRAKDTADFSQQQIQEAMRTDLVDENQQPISDSLAKRFNDIVSLLTTDGTSIDAIQQEIREARLNNDSTLDARFDAIDGGSAPSRTLPNVINEINAGRGAYDTLNARFNADETNINHKVDKDNIYNDLNYVPAQDATDDKVLDARQGKVLKDLLDNIDSAYKAADTSLSSRISAAENALNTLNSDAETAGSVLNTVNTRIADVVAEAPEAFDTLKEIADWIGTHSTSALEMQQDIADNADAIAALEDTITDENTGLAATKAIADAAAVKTEVDSALNGLNTRLGKIDGGEALTDAKTLATRVSEAESAINTLQNEPKSATEVISVSDFEALTANEANSHKDYLVGPDENNLYKYYHIIETSGNVYEKVLISGGGGSGNGNTSGIVLTAAAYNDLEEHDENTDYYVIREDGVHHYRWIPNSNSILESIEICNFINTDNIKTYNATTSIVNEGEEQVTYLDLYEFNYGADNTTIDPQNSTLRAHIPLPKGGSSGTSNNITARLVRIGNETIQTITNSKVNLYIYFSAWDQDQSYSGDYTLKYNNTVIKTGVLTSGAIDATPINWVVVENPQFNEGVPVINSPDASKLYITNVNEVYTQWRYDGSNWSNVSGAPEGFQAIDISDSCKKASINNNVSLSVNYGTDTTPLGKTWKVNIYELNIESNAPETLLINSTESYDFPYTSFGALNKMLHVVIDNEREITASLSAATSGYASTISIPPQAHGTHKIEMYLTAMVGGVEKTTASIIREYIWYDVNNEDVPVLIASPLNGQTISASQYSTINIPYQVYKKNASTIDVYYYLNDNTEPYDHIILSDVNTGIFSYVATNDTDSKITIKVDDKSIVVNLDITASPVNVSPVAGAIIDFDPASLTNSSANRLPKWTVGANTYSLTASDNFNWSEDASGGGYKTDDDGKAFVIKAGSYIDLNYPMFAGTSSNNVLTKGAEMKIIFKTEAVRNIEAVWFTSTGSLTGKTVGIQLGAHYGWLKTDKATDTATEADTSEYDKWASGTLYNVDAVVLYKDTIYKCIAAITEDVAATNPKEATSNWLSMGKIDTEVLATNSYLYFPYSEQDKIELDININKYNSEATTNFIMSYEDGVPSKAYAYEYGAAGDGLYHNNTIRIGSPDCDVYIYRLRIYDKALDTDDILQNFIADGQDITEKVKRYDRNCIYWDSTQDRYFTSPSANAHLDPIKLAEVMPDVKILMLDTPIFTTGKKNFVQNSSLRCIHAEGGNIYKSRGDADNWLFTNGFHSGQGTTSDNYGQSARNVDFLFEVDGENYPAKNKNMKGYTPSKNYVSTVYIGNDASTWDGVSWTPAREPKTTEICSDWKEDNCKISLTETSVPNNYFNLKVNVASSENVNNALFQKRYDDFLAYNSPAQTNQIAKHRNTYAALGMNPDKIKVKNSMEFVPAVLFVRENSEDIGKHTEFKDRNWHFYALGNIGDSKKTDYTRAYDPDDMNEFTLENSDNNTKNGQFQSGVYMDGSTRVVERNESGSNPMQFIWDLSDEEWNATREPTEEEIAAAAEEDGIDVRLPNGQVYVNYRHRMLYAEPFDGDHSFEFRYACCGDYRDGDLINPLEKDTDPEKVARYNADKAQEKLNIGVFYAFYDWLVMSDDATFKAEASQWIVPAAMEFFYAYTHYYTMMDNRAKNTFWHFAKTGTYVEVTHPVQALLHVYEESTDNGATWKKATGTEIDSNKKYRTQYAFDLWAYDMDTAAGIDNNGAQVFPYGKEDGDYRVEGDSLSGYAFNGAGSILWRRIKTSFANEIRDIMTQTDEDCFNAQDLIDEFDNFQNCFPEEIWRLDIERKYIRTFTGESIDNSVEAGKQNPRFLTSMMQGRKKYQRRQWIRDQSVYFNSKYRLPDIVANENTLEFNATTPDVPLWVSGNAYAINNYVRVKVEPFNEEKPRYEVYRCIEANNDTSFIASKWHKSVTPSYYLQLTPYQDMYLNVQLGNGNYQNSYMTDGPATLRAKAGQTYTFDLFGSYQETRIYINGAKHLSAISNLGPMYPYKFDLRGLDHLKVLGIGVDEADYRNAKLDELVLPNFMPLLETVNIKNCHNLGKTLVLSTANNIRTVEAAGTIISGVSLPDYTSIETLHIPSTVIAVNLYGARFLTDFKIYNSANSVDYSALYKLHVYDSDYSSTVDWIDIATAMLAKQSSETEISLLKLNMSSIESIQELESFKVAKENSEIINLSGMIHVTGDWSEVEAKTYAGNTGHYIIDENNNVTWQNLYTSTSAIWPDLTLVVEPEQAVTKYKVWYVKENAIRNVSNEFNEEDIYAIRYVTANDPAPDIYFDETAPNKLSPLSPSKPKDKAYIYTFGLRDTRRADYIEYSGWRYEGSNQAITSAPIISGETVLMPYFKVTTRLYTINWYLDEEKTQLIKSSESPEEYGQGYEQLAPTPDFIHGKQYETCSITINNGQITECKIFDGWQTSPANINPSGDDDNFDIIAKWNSYPTSIVNMFSNTDNLTPQQLLTFSSLTEDQKETYGLDNLITVNTTIKYQLGHDSIKEGTTIYSDKANPMYFNGTGATTNIQPLISNNDAFTLVIDYCLESLDYNRRYAVIASCYHSADNVRSGLGLFYNNNTQQVEVGFGAMYTDVTQRTAISSTTTANMRNIVVIRHPKNSPTVYIYSSMDNNTSLPENVFETSITRANELNFNSDAYLNFCQLIDTNREAIQSGDGIMNNITAAKCNIYWAKYWNEDLGYSECLQLASWPHEWMTFGIPYAYKDNNSGKTIRRASGNSIPTPTLYLATLNTPMHGQINSEKKQQGVFVNNLYGWGTENNTLHNIINKRIYKSLPTELQSILCKPSVAYQEVLFIPAENQYQSPAYIVNGDNISEVRDYAFAYSIANLKEDANVYEAEDEMMNPFSWLISQNVQVYTRAANQSWISSTVNGLDYLNLRFPGKAIHFGTGNNIMRVYQESLSAPTNTIVQSIGNTNIRSGDIYIDSNGAYIYVSNEEINTYGLITMPSTGDYSKFAGVEDNIPGLSNSEGTGGWVKANSYWTRSIYCGSSNAANFTYVQGNDSTAGQIVEATQSNTANISYLLGI